MGGNKSTTAVTGGPVASALRGSPNKIAEGLNKGRHFICTRRKVGNLVQHLISTSKVCWKDINISIKQMRKQRLNEAKHLSPEMKPLNLLMRET